MTYQEIKHEWEKHVETCKNENFGRPLTLKSYLRKHRIWSQATPSSIRRLKNLAMRRAEKLNSVPADQNHAKEYFDLKNCCEIMVNLNGLRGSESYTAVLYLASEFSKIVKLKQKTLT